MTMDAYDADSFRDLAEFKKKVNTNELVAAVVSQASATTNENLLSLGVPKNVQLTIQYYQREKSVKRIIAIQVDLLDYTEVIDAEAPGARDYQLNINFHALGYYRLLNAFAFDVELYVVLFLAVALFYLFFSVLFWAIHRVFTRLSAPLPPFRFMSYVRLTSIQPLQGFVLALIPLMLAIFFMELFFWWTDIFADQDTAIAPINDENQIPESEIERRTFVRNGRFAVGLFVFGIYATFQSAKLLTPDKEAVEVPPTPYYRNPNPQTLDP